jgi:hypothetical protein
LTDDNHDTLQNRTALLLHKRSPIILHVGSLTGRRHTDIMIENDGDVLEAGEFRFPKTRLTSPRRVEQDPAVRIQKSGEMHINEPAYAASGSPEAVELRYDAQRNAIGIIPTDAKNPSASLHRRDKNRSHVHIFSGGAFVRVHGIDTSTARRYPAKLISGILVVPLDEGATTSAGRSTHGGAGGEESDAESS